MPKKRHQARYSKPQSTAPASLSISSAATAGGSSIQSNRSSRRNSQHDDASQGRGVNELLADLRRTTLSGGGGGPQPPVEMQPTLPPTLRSILQLPETPALRPRRLDRRLVTHSGPPPPQSWLSAVSRAAAARKAQQYGRPGTARGHHYRPLPGTYLPAEGSLIHTALRRLAEDWEFQKVYCRYCLYDLPTHLRVALVAYLGVWNPEGVTLADLRAVLLPPADDEEGREGRVGREEGEEVERPSPSPSPSSMNEFFSHLDLAGSLGRSLKLRELLVFLFPSRSSSNNKLGANNPQVDSWDDAPEEQDEAAALAMPRPLLPNLTHLSLGIRPECAAGGAVSWRQLLAFLTHCPRTLTHLSLAFWPSPSLTPNAKLASFVTAQGRSVPYSGTGPYSHSLDNDWSEAIMVLRRLSKTAYSLEYLDLTGCGEWWSALWSAASAGHGSEQVDWVGDWGKMETLVLDPGYELGSGAGAAETARYFEDLENAERVERHVRAKRAGRGRRIAVETGRGVERV